MAPEEWTDQHIQQRYNAKTNIVALCPVGDITARVISFPPGDSYKGDFVPEFEVFVFIEIDTGMVGVYGWPWQVLDSYPVPNGTCRVRFCGYRLDEIEKESDFSIQLNSILASRSALNDST